MLLNDAGKVRVVSLALVFFTFFVWYDLSFATYESIKGVLNNSDLVVINVYSLWVPVGGLGALLSITCMSPFLIYSGKPATELWGKKVQQVIIWVTGVSAILGVFFAIGTYQWLTSELDVRGFVYSEEESQLSAMGKREVYVKQRVKSGIFE